jgi:hypothetical protein
MARKHGFLDVESEAYLRGISVEEVIGEEANADMRAPDGPREQPVFDTRADDAIATPVDGDDADDAPILDVASVPQSINGHTPRDDAAPPLRGLVPTRSDLAIWAKGR